MNQLVVSVNGNDRVVYQDFRYKDIVVPKGFVFNGNSIPRLFRWFLGKYEYLEASCIHDYLYDTKSDHLKKTKKQADIIYMNLIIRLSTKNNKNDMAFKLKKMRAGIIYFFIKEFGHKYYKAHQKKSN
ncbi:DUF1353 domain-containing protein [Francisella philomiragia]|uniref:DUF1353 domain-containing protein n=1 Tax=Francisella philomiragia TaxID=28110 RepID=UPI001C9E03BD|nr:DUF1353 domain-containing protein [Francisella philomiragia]MBY7733483.1 DUF1353 domain-containing protein [Francisella philomiragia]